MERIRHPEVTPFEVWDLLVDGKRWGELTCSPDFPAAFRKGIELLHAGRGLTRSGGALPSVVSPFDALYLAGGRGHELREGLGAMPCPIVFGEGGLFAGARGGFDLLQARGLSGWVVDLGQSHLKIISPGRRWVFPRDWTRLRQTVEVLPQERPAHRRRLREFIAIKLQLAMADACARPAGMVFALPTRIGDDGTPEGSSYAGMRGDRALLPDVVEQAGLPGLPLLVLNDAELAALGARLDERLARFRKVLVLTFGFGIGAAMIHRLD